MDLFLEIFKAIQATHDQLIAAALVTRDQRVNSANDTLAESLDSIQKKANVTLAEVQDKYKTKIDHASQEKIKKEKIAKGVHGNHLIKAKKEREETLWLEDAQLESSLHKVQAEHQSNHSAITKLSELITDLETQLVHALRPAMASKLFSSNFNTPEIIDNPSMNGLQNAIDEIDAELIHLADGGVFKLFRGREKTLEIGIRAYQSILHAKAYAESLCTNAMLHHDARAAEIQAKHQKEVGYANKSLQITAQNSEQKAGTVIREAYEAYEIISTDVKKRKALDLQQLRNIEHQLQQAAKDKHESVTDSAENVCQEIIEQSRSDHKAGYTRAQDQLAEAVSVATHKIRVTREQSAISNPSWPDLILSTQPTCVPQVISIANASLSLQSRNAQLNPPLQEQYSLPDVINVPLVLTLPGPRSFFIEHDAKSRDQALSTMRSLMLRILASFPAGKVRFMMADPIEIGQSFAGFMPLSDQDPSPVGHRIWTDPQKIERQLADITEHMQTVIQKYLRADYETIEDYNKAAGEISEPYRFVIIADLPAALTENGAARLKSILETGPRCGVYAILSADTIESLPSLLTADTLESTTLRMLIENNVPKILDDRFEEVQIRLDDEPADEVVSQILDRVAKAGTDAGRVEVPFDRLAPEGSDMIWSRSCDDELVIPIGRSGAQKNQELRLGLGTRQHALIAGRTGSGKSTLLHVIITAAALWHSPDELHLYLIDFKKGVEFKAYTTGAVPHIRAVAIESDREFGLSVLKRLDDEMTSRGELFRKLGAQDLASARSQAPQELLPRVLLLIDEFQEFFTEDDEVSSEATLLLDRLVRQGRAFGVHVVLGSQTLAGAYSLARSTLGQIGVRIALQCSEADSYLILGEDNNAARLLERPGEAIYNNAGGLMEGNSPFQTAWLSDAQRDSCLKKMPHTPNDFPPTVVFEGNLPAQFDASAKAFAQAFPVRKSPRVLLGDAVAISPPTSVSLQKRSGSNLLIIGPQPEPALGMLVSSAITAGSSSNARVIVIDPTPDDDAMFERISSAITASGIHAQIVTHHQAEEIVAEINQTIEERGEHAGDPIILVLAGIHRLRSLRKSDDYSFSLDESSESLSPDKAFANILREGPAVGVWTLAWCDTLTNVERAMERSTVREFGLRALMQMSASDSAALVDSSIASTLGANRAILADDVAGTLQKFIPIDLPNAELARAAAKYLS